MSQYFIIELYFFCVCVLRDITNKTQLFHPCWLKIPFEDIQKNVFDKKYFYFRDSTKNYSKTTGAAYWGAHKYIYSQ